MSEIAETGVEMMFSGKLCEMTPAVALVVSETPKSEMHAKRMNTIASWIKREHVKKAMFLNTLVIHQTIIIRLPFNTHIPVNIIL